MSAAVDFVEIDWNGGAARIEYQWLGDVDGSRPLLVFLHEGLGSLSMWKDFPASLCAAAGCRGLAFSRPGYGRSTPPAAGERWSADYMHRQALEVLPAVLQALGVDESPPPWLLGHSDGGSIALLYAARQPARTAGLVLLAPHILVEQLSIDGIARARDIFLQTDGNDFREKLGRYHDDPDAVFWRWNEIWLAPEFRGWNIEAEIAGIDCPLLAIQGLDDEYGTLEQLYGVRRHLPQTRVVELADCGHSPHRDQREALISIVAGFVDACAPLADERRGYIPAGA